MTLSTRSCASHWEKEIPGIGSAAGVRVHVHVRSLNVHEAHGTGYVVHSSATCEVSLCLRVCTATPEVCIPCVAGGKGGGECKNRTADV